jgi:hypothetical protein
LGSGKGVDTPAGARAGLPERRQEALSIDLIAEDRLLAIAPVQQMINRPGKFHPSFARHGLSLPAARATCPANLPRFTD